MPDDAELRSALAEIRELRREIDTLRTKVAAFEGLPAKVDKVNQDLQGFQIAGLPGQGPRGILATGINQPGKDGRDGANGTNGTDGVDGQKPISGIITCNPDDTITITFTEWE